MTDRKLTQASRNLAAFKVAATAFDSPLEALRHTRGFQAVWDAVKRVAGALLGYRVYDIGPAWMIVYYVNTLPDGPARLKAATNTAIERWEAELKDKA